MILTQGLSDFRQRETAGRVTMEYSRGGQVTQHAIQGIEVGVHRFRQLWRALLTARDLVGDPQRGRDADRHWRRQVRERPQPIRWLPARPELPCAVDLYLASASSGGRRIAYLAKPERPNQ